MLDPQIEPSLVLPLRARVDLEAMIMIGYSAFPKASQEIIRSFNHISKTLVGWMGGDLHLCRVSVFYSLG